MAEKRFVPNALVSCVAGSARGWRALGTAAAAAALSTAALAAPTSVVEVSAGTGALLGSAQSAGSVTDLTSIVGNLRDGRGGNAPNVVDLFKFSANRSGTYFFNTIGAMGRTIADPALFLFDAAGKGVFWNNDASVSPVDTESAFVQSLTAGDYYIGVAFYGVDAYSGFNAMFDTLFSNQGGALTGAGGLDNWQNFSTFTDLWDLSAYQVNIQVPEPPVLALAGLALGVLGWTSRRRTRAAV